MPERSKELYDKKNLDNVLQQFCTMVHSLMKAKLTVVQLIGCKIIAVSFTVRYFTGKQTIKASVHLPQSYATTKRQ